MSEKGTRRQEKKDTDWIRREEGERRQEKGDADLIRRGKEREG